MLFLVKYGMSYHVTTEYFLFKLYIFTLQQKVKDLKMIISQIFPFICLLFLISMTSSQPQLNQQNVPLEVNNFGYQPDGSMDITQAKSAEQRAQFINSSATAAAGTTFLEHLFETDGDDNFHFTLPVEQQIAFYIYTYVIEQGTYVRIKNITTQPAIRLAVFQNGDMIVKNDFYFQKYVTFNGKKDAKYELKFQTSGNTKLISLNMKLLVQAADINKTLVKDDALKYSTLTNDLKMQLNQILNHNAMYWMTGEQNMRKTLKSVRRYYNFELFEMLLVGVASYIQVKTLMKLLRGNSIVV